MPVGMGPHVASRASSCLDFIYNEQDIMSMTDLLELLEVKRRSMVVTPFRLNRFNDHGSHWSLLFPFHYSLFC